MTPDVRVVADCPCACGEAPIWHPDEAALYWSDIPAGRLYRYDPAGGEARLVYEGRLLGGIAVQEDGSLLLLRDHGNVVILRDGRETTVIDEISRATAFNDCLADPAGRVLSGTCAVGSADGWERYGRLYRIAPDGSPDILEEGLICSNGLGLSPDAGTLYFTDSARYEIYTYDYDPATGEIANRRVFARAEPPAKPDGLTVDGEGCVWSAAWEGGRVVRYDPDGAPVAEIAIPARLTTSLAFGGTDLDRLYVTSAGGDDRSTNGRSAGCLFEITDLNVRGRAEFRSRVGRRGRSAASPA